jgi:hypothetical protein
MIYLIGGAPRVGKSILSQQVAAQLRIGWISTDLLFDQLRFKKVVGTEGKWNAEPQAVAASAEWFFPCLERFIWGVSSMAEHYVIEGVSFLPEHVVRLAAQYPIRSVFLGCSKMTLERFDRFPGCSIGYSFLPKAMRQQFAQDIPGWSAFICAEADRFTCPYIDMSDDFPSRLREAEQILTSRSFQEEHQ